MEPLLVIIETGLTHRLNKDGSGPTLEHGTGHWAEAIERFGTSWAGETHLIANHAPSHLIGIGSIRLVTDPIVDPARSLSLRAGSLLVRATDPLLSGAIGSRIMRGNWDAHEHRELADVLRSLVAGDRDVTIFAPTAIPIVAETIVRMAQEYQRVSEIPAQLKLRIRFSSLGQERRALHASYFGLQLKRWSVRAGEIDLRFGVEVESMANRYSEIAGIPVSWVPWPHEVTGCTHSPHDDSETLPHIYVYASRPEQGSDHSLEIVSSLQKTLGPSARFTVQIGRKGRQSSPEMIEELLRTPQVLLIDSGLVPAQLHAQFSDAHVMVLPYEVDRYRGRGSALMWGALDHGIPLIAPAGTGFGDDIARHGIGLTYRHRKDIPTLVARILAEREPFQRAIARYQEHRAAAVREYFG